MYFRSFDCVVRCLVAMLLAMVSLVLLTYCCGCSPTPVAVEETEPSPPAAGKAEDELNAVGVRYVERLMPEDDVYYRPNFPQTEHYYEHEIQAGPRAGEIVRFGPYELRGPNGELVMSGEYDGSGRKHGAWLRYSYGQNNIHIYENGVVVSSEVLPKAECFVIDFGACVPHWDSVTLYGTNPAVYEVLGADGDFCEFRIASDFGCATEDLTQGYDFDTMKWINYRVPRELGRVPIWHGRIAFLDPYIVDSESSE